MGHLTPTEAQIRSFSEHPHSGTIWMWNLLRFNQSGGQDSYQRYVEEVKPLVEKRGGRIMVRSRGETTVIGPDSWDEALVIEYLSGCLHRHDQQR